MHILEKFSLNCGINPLKLNNPEIYCSYYPITTDRYIVIHAGSGAAAKNYSYFQDVIDLIEPILSENGFGIVQIGGKNDKPLSKCINLQGKTNINQTSFILKNCSLLIANESFSTHICSSFGNPTITLYSVSLPQITGPYWSNPKNLSIVADTESSKPKYSDTDPDKAIDKIKPEQILNSIKECLPDISWDKLTIPETIFIGENYTSQEINLVPDFPVKINIPDQFDINIRFDYLKQQELSEVNFTSALVNTQDRKFSITLSSPINIGKIINQNNIKNLKHVLYIIDQSNLESIDQQIEFIRSSRKSGLQMNVALIKDLFSNEEINDIKFKFINIQPVNEIKQNGWNEETLNNIKSKITDLTVFKSSCIIYSMGKCFLSEQSLIENKPALSNTQPLKDIKNLKELAKEASNLYIYNT